MAKKKSYLIIHDFQQILVGYGGSRYDSFKHKMVDRPGFHLPGGTQDDGETPIVTVRRELREEMGLTVGEVPIPNNCASFLLKDYNNVTFFLVNIKDIERFRGQVNVKQENPFDTPFQLRELRTITDCKSGAVFNRKDGTDWFQNGIEQAFPE